MKKDFTTKGTKSTKEDFNAKGAKVRKALKNIFVIIASFALKIFLC